MGPGDLRVARAQAGLGDGQGACEVRQGFGAAVQAAEDLGPVAQRLGVQRVARSDRLLEDARRALGVQQALQQVALLNQEAGQVQEALADQRVQRTQCHYPTGESPLEPVARLVEAGQPDQGDAAVFELDGAVERVAAFQVA